MTAIRASCASAICVLLVAMPTLAEEKKQTKQMQPQAVQRQQSSSPSLPAEGQNFNRPKGAPAGGSSDSLNMGKPANAAGTPTVGGQAIGGSAAAGASLGTAATSAQPASGGTLVNPNANHNPTGGAMPKDFSRGAKLQEAVDGGAGAMKGEAAKKEGNAPGRQSGAAAIDGANANFDALRGDQGTRSSQQGMFPSSTGAPPAGGVAPIPYPVTTTPPPTRESNVVKVAPKDVAAKPVGGRNGDEAGVSKGVVSGATAAPDVVIMKDRNLEKSGAAVGGIPAATVPRTSGATRPSTETDAGKPSKTLEQAKAERARQTGLPADDRQQVNRMRADERAASATMAERRGNLTNPGEQAPVGGAVATGSKPSSPGASSGRPAGSAVPRKGCPPDNPAC